jgi:hypothetical protein
MHIGATHVSVACPAGYGLSFVGLTALVRVSMCALRTWQLYYEDWPQDFGRVFWRDITGRADIERVRDFLVPMFLGMIELTIYPVLIAATQWQPIGGWLAIKTAASWRWQTSTTPDAGQSWMRFLLGNALSLLASWVLATMIRVP